MFEIITIGSNTIDAFVKTNEKAVHVFRKIKGKKTATNNTMLAYPLGQKIPITHLEFQVGGGGTNTSVAFSRLGFRTAYLGKIGNDENGVKVFRLLKDENIRFIGSVGSITGFSVVLDSIEEDRTILTYKGCNDELKLGEIEFDLLKTKWFYFSSMMGDSLKTAMNLAKYANKKGIKIAFNPSMYLAIQGIKNLRTILNSTHILVLNKEEAFALSGEKTIEKAIKRLKKEIKGYSLITDGSKGAWCYDGKTLYHGEPRKNLKIVETTGAGDAFASGFVCGIMIGKNPLDSLRMGFIESEAVIQAYGAKNNLLSRKKVLEALKKDKRRIIVKTLNN